VRRIVAGTFNRGKLREIRAILADVPVELIALGEFPGAPEILEDGETFDANAIKKACDLADALGEWVIADDSGLEVDALSGQPGIYSARYAGPEKNDAANVRKLLAELNGVPSERRTAAFRCACALARPGELLCTAEGRLEGKIIFEPRGENGFGYDPIFRPRDEERTVAEMIAQEKNGISHRGLALRAIKPKLIAKLEEA